MSVNPKGIALEFKTRYPEMFKEYAAMCNRNEVTPGIPYLYRDIFGTSILNFPTKDHWKSPSKLSYIVDGLDWFIKNYSDLGITSIAFPPLGCGNGGLSWELVGPIMYNKLKNLPIEIEIYAPFGTKQEHLTIGFLKAAQENINMDTYGIKFDRRNKNWDLLMYVVQQLSNSRYSLYVGRTIFQKICYIMTHEGIETGFNFTKGSYGPYSNEIKNALTVLSNSNILREKLVGKMMHITVSDSFKLDKAMYTEKDISIVNKTIDLFSRIKNTDQAEMITTVIFSYDYLSKSKKNISVSDIDIYNYVIDWKKHWKLKKDKELCSTIQNLSILDWIKPSYSGKLDYSTEI